VQSCFALADCNNFYASCESVFQPALAGRPVVVAGNNDGNIIARSREAKALGIPMGAPLYQLRELIARHSVAVYSGNFALYADMSSRVMDVLGRFTPTLDVYSIDEAFLALDAVPPTERAAYAADIRAMVLQWTGIPVSIGVASTKTLSKIAAEVAKQTPAGVLALASPDEVDELLRTLPVGEVWGIGPARTALLLRHGIETAHDFARADSAWVRRHLTVMGQRTQLELRGISCLPLEPVRAAKQQVCCSRSFGCDVRSLDDMREAVAQFASWAGEKIRAQGSAAAMAVVFIATNSFRKGIPQHHESCTIRLPRPTSDTLEIVDTALRAVERLYQPGYAYHKAGVILTGLTPDTPSQLAFFEPLPDPRRRELMQVLDAINGRFGRDVIRVGAAGTVQQWRMRQRNRSPRYTTRWDELMRVL
jgi:DNA polymerase V